MKKSNLLILFLCVVLIIQTFTSCGVKNLEKSYQTIKYTRKELHEIYYKNSEQFNKLVDVIKNNDDFYEKGKVWEDDTKVMFTSPYDDQVLLFNDADREVIYEFFDTYRPYSVCADCLRNWIKITFHSSDLVDDSYNFIFFICDSERSKEIVEDKHYPINMVKYIEYIDENCYLYY
jgi:hypothetical protein